MAGGIEAVGVGVAFVALVFAGCLGDAADPIAPFVVPDIHGFEAAVDSSNGAARVTLDGPVEVLVGAEHWFKAYRFHMAWPQADGEDVSTTQFLDRDLRVVASSSGCGFHPNACDHYISWDWVRQGSLAAVGLGYPNLIQADAFSVHRGSLRLPVDWEVVPSSTGRLALRVSEPGMGGEVWEGEFAYTKGRLLPDATGWTVTSYEAKEVLAPADRLAFPPEPIDAAPWDGMMFPGETAEAFGLGLSHVEVVQRVFPGFVSNETTCVGLYQWRFAAPGKPPTFLGLVPLPPNGREAVGWLHVDIVGDGADRRRSVEVWRDSGGELRFDVQGEDASGGTTCATVQRSPFPAMDFEAGVAHARTLVEGGNLSTFVFSALVGVPWMTDPESGWHAYTFGFEPTAPTGLSYAHEVSFKPVAGKPLVRALVAPGGGFVRDA